jgi:undecaprenyl-diphosphatase
LIVRLSPYWRDRARRFAGEWSAAVLVALAALFGVGKVGEDLFNHESGAFDGIIRHWVLAHQSPAVATMFRYITVGGQVSVVATISVLVALYLLKRRGRRVAAVSLVAPTLAIVLFVGVKAVYARPRPNFHGHPLLGTYSFPSGHATASAAVCCTIAYVCWRERIFGGGWALFLAIVPPLLIGISRVYLTYHWATDVLGGWSAGVLAAVSGAVLYDRARTRADSASANK